MGYRYMNVELDHDEAQEFRAFLKSIGVRYEASGAGNLIHLECRVDNMDVELINGFLRDL